MSKGYLARQPSRVSRGNNSGSGLEYPSILNNCIFIKTFFIANSILVAVKEMLLFK